MGLLKSRDRHGARVDRFTMSMIEKWEARKKEAQQLQGTLWRSKDFSVDGVRSTTFYDHRMVLVIGTTLDSFPHPKIVIHAVKEGEGELQVKSQYEITLAHLKDYFELVSRE